ncbi:MAG: GlgB N-terminal domain-containing protein, partial [Acidimicrobiia bacterium]
MPRKSAADLTLLTAEDFYLFNEGTHYRLHEKLGAHLVGDGTYFAVWAPNARSVSLVGDFNGWDRERDLLRPTDSGIWEGFVPGVGQGQVYKYALVSHHGGHLVEKADPFGFLHEVPPKTASVVWDLEYDWDDSEWMQGRGRRNSLDAPISIYEVHLGSWRRVPEDGKRPLSYRELAPLLAQHVSRLGFTHVEFLPVMEHPFFGSWGY